MRKVVCAAGLLVFLLSAGNATAGIYNYTPWDYTGASYSLSSSVSYACGAMPPVYNDVAIYSGTDPRDIHATDAVPPPAGPAPIVGYIDNLSGERSWVTDCVTPTMTWYDVDIRRQEFVITVNLIAPLTADFTWEVTSLGAAAPPGSADTMTCTTSTSVTVSGPVYDLANYKCTFSAAFLPGISVIKFEGAMTKAGITTLTGPTVPEIETLVTFSDPAGGAPVNINNYPTINF